MSVDEPILAPFRWPMSNCGALLILSMPPATMALYSPARILFAAIMAALSDEPHTLLMVVQGVETGSPAPRAT